MKKVINNPNNVVEELLEGMCYAHPKHVRKLDGLEVLVRTNSPVDNKVALVSGGGSGHEPSHGGFVGRGMLDAAVAGAVLDWLAQGTPRSRLLPSRARMFCRARSPRA